MSARGRMWVTGSWGVIITKQPDYFQRCLVLQGMGRAKFENEADEVSSPSINLMIFDDDPDIPGREGTIEPMNANGHIGMYATLTIGRDRFDQIVHLITIAKSTRWEAGISFEPDHDGVLVAVKWNMDSSVEF
jgi:hypothetical protein